MPAQRRTATTEDHPITMHDYQRAIHQHLHWPHYTEDGVLEPIPVPELHPARAINALHKLGRWHHSLFNNATQLKYDESRADLFASELVGALIEQALGPFYAGTYLQTTTAVPHVEEIAAAGERYIVGVKRGITDERILDASIHGAVALDNMADESIGRRVTKLADIIATTFQEDS